MIDFKEIPYNDDTWELFARDFLLQLGFFIETSPDRGADGGKDMLVTEEVKGKLHSYRFRWLVSCKHFATSGNSVNENDHEKNILERVKSFKADGFLGFYSTVPSAGLNTRLAQLRTEKEIKDYRIFDHKLIENYMISLGFSQIMFRYMPENYKKIRPLHKIIDEYVPITCDCCGKDLLEALYHEKYSGLVAQVQQRAEDGRTSVVETYFACKGRCDKTLENRYWNRYKEPAGWKDLSDIAMPNEFLRWLMATINQLHDENFSYSESAIDKERTLIIALSQKIFREVAEEERVRMKELMSLPF
jgi:hypothetical protein